MPNQFQKILLIEIE